MTRMNNSIYLERNIINCKGFMFSLEKIKYTYSLSRETELKSDSETKLPKFIYLNKINTIKVIY